MYFDDIIGGGRREWAEIFLSMGLFPDFPYMSYWPELNHITTPCCKGARESDNLLKGLGLLLLASVNRDSVPRQGHCHMDEVGGKKGTMGLGRLSTEAATGNKEQERMSL